MEEDEKEEIRYLHILSTDIWWHILLFLPPISFLRFSSTCKQLSSSEMQNKFFINWFQSQGCAGYLSSQVVTALKRSRKDYYSMVNNLIQEFKMISLPNGIEPTTPSPTTVLLCKESENLLAYYERSSVVIEYSARPPYEILNKWEVNTPAKFSTLSEYNGDYFLLVHDEAFIHSLYLLQSGGSMQHLYTVNVPYLYYAFYEGYTVELNKVGRSNVLSVHQGDNLLWTKSMNSYDRYNCFICDIHKGAVLVEYENQFRLFSLNTGAMIAEFSLFFSDKETYLQTVAKILLVEDEGRYQIWLVAVIKNFRLWWRMFREDGHELESNSIVLKLKNDSALPVSICIHLYRFVIVHADGSISVIPRNSLPKVFRTLVGFSGTNIIAGEVTEDSRVFLTTSTGLVLALDFTSTDYWKVFPAKIDTPITSQVVDKIITTMLHKIGELTIVLLAATSNSHLSSFINQFQILQTWFHYITKNFPHLQRLTCSAFINNCMTDFGRLNYLWENTLALTDNNFQGLYDLQQRGINRIDELLYILDTTLTRNIYPHFPLRKTLNDLKLQQNYVSEYNKIMNWITIAKKFPITITLDKLYANKQAIIEDLAAVPDLYKVAIDSLEEVESIFMSDLSQTIIQAVTDPYLAITSKGTFQSSILENLYILVSFHAFQQIKPNVLNALNDFLLQLKSIGDLNEANQKLVDKVTTALNGNKEISDTSPSPVNLEPLTKYFINSIAVAKAYNSNMNIEMQTTNEKEEMNEEFNSKEENSEDEFDEENSEDEFDEEYSSTE